MTVLVSVKINDGVVMAADSASSFASGMVYRHADKIVNLRQGLPIGAMVTGGAPFSAGLAMGLAFMTTGVAFKIAAVPFHYWTPDAYQGSPTPVTGYLSVGPKVGAFALILRLLSIDEPPVRHPKSWQ